jgi:ornithine cyclodeaminase/alanine dehydrogenase-like protein (mu-crystallin family)
MPLLLSEQDVRALVGGDDMPEAIDIIERAYRERAAGRATCVPRATVQYPPDDGYDTDVAIRILPGMVPALGSAAMRVYANHHAAPVRERGPRVLDCGGGRRRGRHRHQRQPARGTGREWTLVDGKETR